MAPRKGTPRTAAAKKTPAASKTAVKPASLPKGTTKRPEADSDGSAIYRADMGEGLPQQKPFPTATDKAK